MATSRTTSKRSSKKAARTKPSLEAAARKKGPQKKAAKKSTARKAGATKAPSRKATTRKAAPKKAAAPGAGCKDCKKNGCRSGGCKPKDTTGPEPKAAAKPKKKMRRVPQLNDAPPRPTAGYESQPEVLEFIGAIDAYKKVHSRPFPGWSEIHHILVSLGYRKD